MSACPDRLVALSAYVDGELDPTATEELEAHLASCPPCREELETLSAVSDAVQSILLTPGMVSASDLLRSRIVGALATAGRAGSSAHAAAAPGGALALADPPAGDDAGEGTVLGAEARGPGMRTAAAPGGANGVLPAQNDGGIVRPARFRRPAPGAALAAAAVVVLALIGGYAVGAERGQSVARDAVTAELLSGHLRAMLPGRLTDVQSSDRHQVKPWFAGQVDFSPPVPDMAAQGFPLLGGRLDYVAGQRAAVLVYLRRLHVIDVFVLPASSRAVHVPAPARLGYNFVSWREGPLRLIAVSDLDPLELRQLARLHTTATAGAAPAARSGSSPTAASGSAAGSPSGAAAGGTSAAAPPERGSGATPREGASGAAKTDDSVGRVGNDAESKAQPGRTSGVAPSQSALRRAAPERS